MYISKRIESNVSKRYLCTHIQSSPIHNPQEVEEIQMSILFMVMDKQNVVYSSNGIALSLKQEGSLVTCCNTDEPEGQYAN